MSLYSTEVSSRLKRWLILCSVLCLFTDMTAQNKSSDYDLVILGATPGGIMAAIEGSRQGKTCLLLERSFHIGGLPANGLGATDISTEGAVGGLFREFVTAIEKHYRDTYGVLSEQYRTCKKGYRFEPSVAERVFHEMIAAEKGITVLTGYQFNGREEDVHKEERYIRSLKVTHRESGEERVFSGKVFVDATYEGDLIAAAGVPYTVGREGKEAFGEELAGKVYKYWEGRVAEGSTFMPDDAIQAYNYRLCLTRDPENRNPIPQPETYNREEYLSLIEDVVSGRHAGKEYDEFLNQTSGQERENIRAMGSKEPPRVPGNPRGISKILNPVALPNNKTDANNQQRAFLSSDLPEENWLWPEASWEWRDRFAERLKNYTLGLLWFAQHDPDLPLWFREEILPWGLARDEYMDNNNFPRQVYVREGRRMKGQYFYTAFDALPVKKGERPPVHPSSVTAGHYSIDSHGVRKRESGRVHLDGFISQRTAPFTVPYGVMVPPEVSNLLAPVPVSGSHLGFSVLRMEPTWMALGQAAGLAASISVNRGEPVQDIPVRTLQLGLLESGAVLMYYKDLSVEDPYYKALQWMGVHGFFQDWHAHPESWVTESELLEISRVFRARLQGVLRHKITRANLALSVYEYELHQSGITFSR
ncbi:FAD-dependent oxidoreductase [Robertkochia flava]|uniref:FAD-dependent oxidoreductase n=1 Tax=Robertkochia flava TaxID=3447986 RepID=UPI001CCF1C1A|nr:FAD-dependent oxidoreductase [Robertkochia marina]